MHASPQEGGDRGRRGSLASPRQQKQEGENKTPRDIEKSGEKQPGKSGKSLPGEREPQDDDLNPENNKAVESV